MFSVSIRNVDGVGPVESSPRCAFDLAATSRAHHHKVISLHKLREPVAFNKHARRLHARQCLLNSLFNLRVSRYQPVNVCSSSIPVPSSILPRFVSLFTARTDQRLFTQKMTHTTCMRILAARTIVTASYLDRLPTRQRYEQFTQQRRLPHFGSKPTNTDDNRLPHHLITPFDACGAGRRSAHSPSTRHAHPC